MNKYNKQYLHQLHLCKFCNTCFIPFDFEGEKSNNEANELTCPICHKIQTQVDPDLETEIFGL